MLIASLLGVLLATVAGVALGLAAGIAPRWLNSVLMRVIDVLLAIPVLMIALILIATAGSGVAQHRDRHRGRVHARLRPDGGGLRPQAPVGGLRAGGAGLRRHRARISVRHLLPNLMTEVWSWAPARSAGPC